jgi:transposase
MGSLRFGAIKLIVKPDEPSTPEICDRPAVARQDEAVWRLMTAPGVGVLVALAYVSVVDAPERFAKSSSVGAYIGLTPRRY